MTLLRARFNSAALDAPTPATAYFLGFLWGDGYIYRHPAKRQSTVSIEIEADDMDSLFPHFCHICNWNVLARKRASSNTLFTRIYSGDPNFYARIEALGYREKAGNYQRVLEVLPAELHRFFFRGLIDADGSVGRYNAYCVLHIAGPYDQDWTSLQSFCEKLGVACRIKRRHLTKRASHSVFIVSGRKAFVRLLDEIYRDINDQSPYLPRKYLIYREILHRLELGISGDVKKDTLKIQLMKRKEISLDTEPKTERLDE